MTVRRIQNSARAAGLPFNVWWAIGEAMATALVLAALRLTGGL